MMVMGQAVAIVVRGPRETWLGFLVLLWELFFPYPSRVDSRVEESELILLRRIRRIVIREFTSNVRQDNVPEWSNGYDSNPVIGDHMASASQVQILSLSFDNYVFLPQYFCFRGS